MRAYRVRLGRWVIASFEVEGERIDPVQLMADAITQLQDDTTEDADDAGGISGGSAHDFERVENPVSPDDRYAPWDDKFGFHR